MRQIIFWKGLVVGLVLLVVTMTLTACGRSEEPVQAQPTEPAPPSAPLATETPAPTPTLRPTPTPLPLSQVADEFRTFVNEAHDYAIQMPLGWEITPRGAYRADRIEVTVPGASEIRGANTLPPLTFSIAALDSGAGYSSFQDVEEDRSFGQETVYKFDIEINGLPARHIRARDDVYGDTSYYLIERDSQFFLIHGYGYDQAPLVPVLNSFGPPPDDLATETVAGQVKDLDASARTMLVVTEAGSEQRVAWFTDTEILPRRRLEGHIDTGDRLTVEGIVAENGDVRARAITLEAPQHDGSEAVLEFRRTGGVAGFQDQLVVFNDGVARLQRGEEEPIEKQLSDEQWAEIENYVVIFRPFAWHQQDNPEGPDNLVTDLDFYGTGKFDAVFDDQEEIVNYLQELIATF